MEKLQLFSPLSVMRWSLCSIRNESDHCCQQIRVALRVENLCVNCSLSCLVPTEPAFPLGHSGANLAGGFTQEFQVLVTGAAVLKGMEHCWDSTCSLLFALLPFPVWNRSWAYAEVNKCHYLLFPLLSLQALCWSSWPQSDTLPQSSVIDVHLHLQQPTFLFKVLLGHSYHTVNARCLKSCFSWV